MSAIKAIRKHLGMTQAELAAGLGVSQGNVSFYERGQVMPPPVAARLIKLSAERGVSLSFDHVYGAVELPPEPAEVRDAA